MCVSIIAAQRDALPQPSREQSANSAAQARSSPGLRGTAPRTPPHRWQSAPAQTPRPAQRAIALRRLPPVLPASSHASRRCQSSTLRPARSASSLPAVTASSEPLLSAAPASSACVSTRIDSITSAPDPLNELSAQSRPQSCSSPHASSAAVSAGSPKRTSDCCRRARPPSPSAAPA